MLIISALGRGRKKDKDFKANLSYITSASLRWDLFDPLSLKKRKRRLVDAPMGKCLLCKCGDPCSDAQNPCRARHNSGHL